VEEVVWAAAAAVVALIPPVRRRFIPVSKAVLAGGLSVGIAALRGVEGVVVAAACGERPAQTNGSVAVEAAGNGSAGTTSATKAPKRARPTRAAGGTGGGGGR
jgi:hypothetical protein